MVYALAAIGLVIGLFIWSMCRIAGRYDENFEPLDQHDRHTDQRDLSANSTDLITTASAADALALILVLADRVIGWPRVGSKHLPAWSGQRSAAPTNAPR